LSFADRIKSIPKRDAYYGSVDDLLEAVESDNGKAERDAAEVLLLSRLSNVDIATQLAEEGYKINRDKVGAWRKANRA